MAYYESRERQLGVSLWATTGNESDIGLAEILSYYAADDAIKVILLYMEGCKDGAGFMAGLEVIVTKVGASDIGAEAALSHTASITGSDVVFDTVVAKYGAHRTSSMDEFYDIGYASSVTRSFPNGNRVGLVTISGGVGVLMSDLNYLRPRRHASAKSYRSRGRGTRSTSPDRRSTTLLFWANASTF